MRKCLIIILSLCCCVSAFAQKGDLRRGNRQFRKGEFAKADISYRKALMQDSTSVAGTYNLANTLYREKDMENARKLLDGVKETAPGEAFAPDYYFNLGDVAIAQEDWQAAVDAFKQCLLRTPDDLKAKENYIYARNKLQEQQNQDQQGDGNNNQDQDQNQQNQDQNQQNQDQNQNQDQDQQGDNDQDQNRQEPQISPQQAQQMLQAIQQKEKETQEKVDEKKAAALKSRQKEKNW